MHFSSEHLDYLRRKGAKIITAQSPAEDKKSSASRLLFGQSAYLLKSDVNQMLRIHSIDRARAVVGYMVKSLDL
jgi:hypothetical protein